MFGPGHGQTMEVQDSAPDRVIWLEQSAPDFTKHSEFGGVEEMHRQLREDMLGARQKMHQYRRYDVMMSDQTGEECVVYEHEPECCEKRLWDREGASRSEAPDPHRGQRGYGPDEDPRRRATEYDPNRYVNMTTFQPVPYE